MILESLIQGINRKHRNGVNIRHLRDSNNIIDKMLDYKSCNILLSPVSFKDGLSLKIFLHINLYFIASQYLFNYALVVDIDN